MIRLFIAMGNSDYHNEAICQSRPVHILAHSLKRKHAGPPLPKALAWRRALADFRNLVAPRLASPVTPEARDRVQVETLEGVEMAMLRCVGVKGARSVVARASDGPRRK